MEIEILKQHTELSKGEIIAKFQRFKETSKVVEPWVIDTWIRWFTTNIGLREIQSSNITNIIVKSLFDYCIPMFEGNPNTQPDTGGKEGVWLQHHDEIRGVDLSFREFRVPRDKKFKVVYVYPQYRRFGGGGIKSYDLQPELISHKDLLEIGNWGLLTPNGIATGSFVTPLPFPDAKPVPVTISALTELLDEINIVNRWFKQNLSLITSKISPRVKTSIHVPGTVELPKNKAAIIDLLMGLVKIKTQKYSESSVVSDLNNLGLLNIYHFKLLGRNVDKLMDTTETIISNRELLQEQAVKFQKDYFTKRLTRHYAEMLFNVDFDDLTSQQKTSVMKRVDQWHVDAKDPNNDFAKALRKLRHAISGDRYKLQKIWSEMTPYIPSSKTKGPKICPHFVDQVNMILTSGNATTAEIIKNIANKWAEPAPDVYNFYCKECGELLYTDDIQDFNVFGKQSVVTRDTPEYDPLKHRLLGEVLQVLRLVKFRKPRNIQILGTAITSLLEQKLLSVQDKLHKSKSRSIEENNLLTLLSASVLAFAMVSHLITDNPKEINWNVNIEPGTKVNPLGVAYALILNTKNVLIGNIKDLTPEKIKSMLLEFFNDVRLLRPGSEPDESEQFMDSELIWTLRLDPLYNFIVAAYKVNSKFDVKYTDFKSLLGVSDPTNVKLTDGQVFLKAWRPKTTDNKFTKAYQQAIELMVDIGTKKYNFIPTDPIVLEWKKKWEPMILEQNAEDRIRKFTLIRPQIPDLVSKYKMVIPSVAVSDITCPDGTKHDYTIKSETWVFKLRGKTVKLKLKDILELQRSGKWSGYTLVDEECGKCGHPKKSKAVDISAKLESIRVTDFLFTYFENRCPETNELHEFDDQLCKKCKYKKGFSFERPKWYFDKYKSKLPKVVKIQKDTTVPMWKPTISEATKWSHTTAAILQLSKLTNVEYNLWLNLGLTEKRNFTAIQKGRENPQTGLTADQHIIRATKLIGYILHIQRVYFIIKNHNKLQEIPLSIKQLIESESFNVQKMPDNFLVSAKKKIENVKDPVLQANCALSTLCTALIEIKSMDLKKFATRLFKYFVEWLMRSEAIVSKIEVTKSVATSIVSDAVEEDTVQEIEELEDIEPSDPFALINEIDIDTSNTGNDDEEFMD